MNWSWAVQVLIAAANVIIDRNEDLLINTFSSINDDQNSHSNSSIDAGISPTGTVDWSSTSSHRQPRIVTLPIGGLVICGERKKHLKGYLPLMKTDRILFAAHPCEQSFKIVSAWANYVMSYNFFSVLFLHHQAPLSLYKTRAR